MMPNFYYNKIDEISLKFLQKGRIHAREIHVRRERIHIYR